MKTYLIPLAAFILTTSIADAQSTQSRNPFKHSARHTTKSGYSKKAQSLPQRTLEFNWDDATTDWEIMPDSIYTMYNSNGNVLRETRVHYFDATNSSVSATAYTYNAGQRLIAEYNMYLTGQQWDTTYKSLHEYDSHGNPTLSSYYGKTSGVWELHDSYKTLNTYDGNDRLIQDITQLWDETEYVNESKSIYTYDVSGKINSATFMTWNTGTSAFDSSARIINIVWFKWAQNIEDGLIQSYEMQEWTGSTYALAARMNSAYDSHDNMTEEKEEAWVSGGWEVDYWEKFALTYNSNSNLTQRISQSWDGSELVNDRKELFDNFVGSTGLLQITKQSTPLNIYPNPFETSATIEIPSFNHSGNMVLVVYDLLGRSVFTQPIDAPKITIERGDLQQGLYTFHLMENNNVTHSGKFLIK